MANLLKEKKKIEDSTGVTAAREREEQRQRDEVIRKQQERDRYNAERRAKQSENPNRKKNAPNL